MKTLRFEQKIHAPAHRVWQLLWSPETYSLWTKPFCEGSKMMTDWAIGGKTYFLDSKGDGLASTIDTLEEDKEVTFSHKGMMKDGSEIPVPEDQQNWVGAKESYRLEEQGEDTTVHVSIDAASPDMEEYMQTNFPKALQALSDMAGS